MQLKTFVHTLSGSFASPSIVVNERAAVLSESCPVFPFSKLTNIYVFGYFDPENTFFDNENKQFSGDLSDVPNQKDSLVVSSKIFQSCEGWMSGLFSNACPTQIEIRGPQVGAIAIDTETPSIEYFHSRNFLASSNVASAATFHFFFSRQSSLISQYTN